MFIIDTGIKQSARLAELRQLEVDLLIAHMTLAASHQALYAGLTSAPPPLISSIASLSISRVQSFAGSASVGELSNWSPLFRPAFDINELIEESKVRKTDVRLHEGVPPEILNLQYSQQRLLLTYCELATLSSALVSAVLGIRRSEAISFSEINSSNLLNVDSTQLLWALPFTSPAELTRFFQVIRDTSLSSFAFDILKG